MNPDLAAALDELDPEKVTVLGGTAAISQDVVEAVEARYGVAVERIGEVNRFETAALIAAREYDDPVVEVETQTVIVSNGGDANLVDALVAGAIGAASETPILLTGGGGPLDPFTAQQLEELSADETVTVYVAGGTESLPDSIVDQIEDITGEGTVQRVSGQSAESLAPGAARNTRFATASFVNAEGVAQTATATKEFVPPGPGDLPGPGVLPGVTGEVTGASLPDGGTFAGDVEDLVFSVNEAGDTILASGTLVGTVTGAGGEVIDVDEAFEDVPVAVTTPEEAEAAGLSTQAAPAGCAILNLDLGPLSLNLLGL